MLTLGQINNGNTEKDNKFLLIITKMLYEKFNYLAPSASLTFQSSTKDVKKRTWVNFLRDLA